MSWGDAAGLDWRFVAFEVAPGAGADAVRAMRTLGIGGLAVTAPHKTDVAGAVDEVDVAAQALRARGDVWVPTVTHLTSYMVVMAPLAWFLAIPLKHGVNGMVWAVIIASVISCGLLLARFWALSRRSL